jgi:uncharacterized membrane protein
MLSGNQAEPDARKPVAAQLAFGIVLLCIGAIALWSADGLALWQTEQLSPHQQERFHLLLWVAGSGLTFFGLIGVMAAVRPSAEPLRRRLPFDQRTARFVLLGLMAAFTLAYGWLAMTRHVRLNSTTYDLAIHEQAIWSTLHGRFLATSVEVDNALADHFRPFLAVAALVYAPFPSPLTLLGLQAFALALGMIPLYRLAKRRLSSDLLALVVVAAYGLYPAIGFLLRFDFHTEAFAVPAFLAAFDALDQKHWLTASLWLVIPLLCKENMGLTVAAFGLYALVVSRKPTWGSFWLLAGLVTFSVTSFWLIPTLRGESSDTLSRYAYLGDSPRAMLHTLFTTPGVVWEQLAHPRVLLYLTQLLLPLGFLSLLAPAELAITVPGLAVNLLSTSYPQWTIYYQYAVPIIPFVFVSAVYGLARLRTMLRAEWAWRIIGAAVGLLSVATILVDNPFREQPFLPAMLAEIENAETVRLALQTVPDRGSVVTSNNYGPHLAQRPELYIVGVPSQRQAPDDPDIVFFNLRDQRFTSCEMYYSYLLQLDPQRYGVTFWSEGVLVLQRDTGSNSAFQDLLLTWNGCASG